MNNRSKLVRMTVRNIGCIGNDGVTIELDKVVCLVGKNNSGKSTILRAYELAKGSQAFVPARDRCQSAPAEAPSEIELEVHIPEGIGNVDANWKIAKDGLLIVRSRWQWTAPLYQKERTTWDPKTSDWAVDNKAGGADPVFTSRLPRPLRIGSLLDDAEKMEGMLLTLALTPLLSAIERERGNADSELSKSINDVLKQIGILSANHQDHFNAIAQKVTTGFKGVFPKLDVRLNVAPAEWTPKIDSVVKDSSGLLIKDGKVDTSLDQQGTGARRTLFWAMLQVHNEITRDKEVREDYKKKLQKTIADESKKLPKYKDAQLEELQQKIADLNALLAAHEDGAAIPDSPDDPALPGYLLLIDEPENALHPMAARAAQRHLYKLAESADWQVMMTTHSPYFINPLEDHTTIVRLERSTDDDDSPIEPKTYRSDSITFEGDEKKRLQALQHIDPSLAEIFFGSYPILVEGDTEHAAFMSSILEKQHELVDRVTLIRARGKAILVPLISVMRHFKIDFGIVHDCDPPFTKKGDKNGMWTENDKIRNAVLAARAAGVTVRHRVSIPDFERYLGGDEESKDKPLNAYRMVTEDAGLSAKVQTLLNDLLLSEQHEPFPDAILKASPDYLNVLFKSLIEWAAMQGIQDMPRFKGKDASLVPGVASGPAIVAAGGS